jgi:uncharacterized cupredoxin-like copper-binding protein
MGIRRVIAVFVTGAVLAACSSSASNSAGAGSSAAAGNSVAPGSSTAAGDSIDATMVEWSFTLSPVAAASGDVTFNITNDGAFTHEFIIRKTDLAADSLPRNAAGEVDESDPQLEDVGELEDIAAGTDNNTLTVTLTPGHYVIFCNLHVDTVLHYQMGLHTDLTVS